MIIDLQILLLLIRLLINSADVKPLSCIIRICLINVLLPDSPVPSNNNFTCLRTIDLFSLRIFSIFLLRLRISRDSFDSIHMIFSCKITNGNLYPG
ncbi:hypothetical protein DERP_003922 [Dermatophagoides pteronyssinus]|uniref:Secreted protein n=1 Tax=Dermatophagoides pteronyssinus TaxID=6956 RepID=A0ABQ8J7M0_DERPT|nr:hypothetical protein DERP_003922 [Dermatophagoides pteronyssinus]